MSCPPLRSEAYTGARLDDQLEDQARTRTVRGSPIYASYYREDFGGSDAAIGRYLAQFWPDGPERELRLSARFKLLETDYDWTLNSQENARGLLAAAGKQ